MVSSHARDTEEISLALIPNWLALMQEVEHRWFEYIGSQEDQHGLLLPNDRFLRAFSAEYRDGLWNSSRTSSGFPLQVSLDTSSPTQLRYIIDLTALSQGDIRSCRDLNVIHPIVPANMVNGIDMLAWSAEISIGVGLRKWRGEVAKKLYVQCTGLEEAEDWIAALGSGDGKPEEMSWEFVSLTRFITQFAKLDGVGVSLGKIAPAEKQFYYIGQTNLKMAVLEECARLAGVGSVKRGGFDRVAEAMGIPVGGGLNCYMVSLTVDGLGKLKSMKFEFGRGSEFTNNEKRYFVIMSLPNDQFEHLRVMNGILKDVSGRQVAVLPDVTSYRYSISGRDSTVFYLTLPSFEQAQ